MEPGGWPALNGQHVESRVPAYHERVIVDLRNMREGENALCGILVGCTKTLIVQCPHAQARVKAMWAHLPSDITICRSGRESCRVLRKRQSFIVASLWLSMCHSQ